MALPLFAGTLFISAFVLFLVQPIVGKMILPKLGGTPQVWNTCMVFFQTALLAGYAYTHTVSTRLKLKPQLITHSFLLLVALLVLFGTTMGPSHADLGQTGDTPKQAESIPMHPMSMEDWAPSNLGSNPIFDALSLLVRLVGLPFLVIATSAPLLQKWFVYTGHPAAKDPYFLYGASNLGSMMALLLYPVAVEPWLRLGEQAWLFSIGYLVLVAAVLCCIALVFKLAPETAGKPVEASAPTPSPAATAAGTTTAPAAPGTATTATPPSPPPPVSETAKATSIKKGAPKPKFPTRPAPSADADISREDRPVTPFRRLRWVALAAVPSSFMLGITSHITTDLSPVPLFWLVPLTLYLLSFILVYLRWPIVWTKDPHTVCLIAQPIALGFMIFVEIWGWASEPRLLWYLVAANVLAFFLTALVCHGELAKDRPSTTHLTEYYLLMSVGGMVGGMFNGLIAPIFFFGLAEFPIAMFLSCLVRPKMGDPDTPSWTQMLLNSLLNQPIQPVHHHKGPKAAVHADQEPVSYDVIMDFAWPLLWALYLVVASNALASALLSARRTDRGNVDFWYFVCYFIPLAFACVYYARPVRVALTVGAVLLVYAITSINSDSSIYSDRSYFGIIRVKQTDTAVADVRQTFRQLVHGHINHGMNFQMPELSKKQKDDKDFMAKRSQWDFTRLATTYYHRFGPAGIVMEKYNWFSGETWTPPQNTFHADARLPAALAGLVTGDLGSALMPSAALVGMWSEPPFATIGLGTGTMASYARAFQHCHYYEIDNHIRRLSLPEKGETRYFNYLQYAKDRSAEVEVLMGDARLRMAMPYKSIYADADRGGGPNNFYHMMVVDAFSSDAIPAHLITKEAIQMYFTKLTPEGILCVHTSNRFVNLPKVVAAVSSDLGFSYKTGHDSYDRDKGDPNDTGNIGHFTSEWVMVARDAKYLEPLETIMRRLTKGTLKTEQQDDYWKSRPVANNRYLWTDDHYNLINVLRLFDRPGD